MYIKRFVGLFRLIVVGLRVSHVMVTYYYYTNEKPTRSGSYLLTHSSHIHGVIYSCGVYTHGGGYLLTLKRPILHDTVIQNGHTMGIPYSHCVNTVLRL